MLQVSSPASGRLPFRCIVKKQQRSLADQTMYSTTLEILNAIIYIFNIQIEVIRLDDLSYVFIFMRDMC